MPLCPADRPFDRPRFPFSARRCRIGGKAGPGRWRRGAPSERRSDFAVIAIVTGASDCLGRAFVEQLTERAPDEIWCVARDGEKLAALRARWGERIVPLSLDLAAAESAQALERRLREQRCAVAYLIGSAGVGEELAPTGRFSPEQAGPPGARQLHGGGLLLRDLPPLYGFGGHILDIASQSAFQLVPYLNLYASSKAFVRSYTRALHAETRGTGLTAAVCPGWVDTGTLAREMGA
ncbi:SDR family NAD(P)-dependent oxidoreductase [Acetanaerobacterium sp. MSJ-12]|uniref:SDR family NAD(P)-dependent oxidoreductase n=1 Tax=Acetanaerobacterium sp. MSJ-12 TaxID=2841535 RepID=UPI0025710674|nr:SDR family NAD(P)-dependent oxidoreductase [Acetanaerobacterium sp. MSJ-12]